MSPEAFRAWRKRARLTLTGLHAALVSLGYASLTLRAVSNWSNRGAPEHMTPALTLMERAPDAWRR